MHNSSMIFEHTSRAIQPGGNVIQRITWRMMLRTFNWGYAVFTVAFVVATQLMLDGTTGPMMGFERVRLVETLLPLTMALQAASLFSPDDEPALEITAACPRPLWWLLAERFAFLLLIYTIIGTSLTLWLFSNIPEALRTESYLIIALLRWIAPALFLSFSAMWLTMQGRDAALSAMLIGFVWAALALMSQMFAPGAPELPLIGWIQPYVWPFHPYMQPTFMPTPGDYWLNRAIVIAQGIPLGILSLRYLRHTNVEWIVFAGKK